MARCDNCSLIASHHSQSSSLRYAVYSSGFVIAVLSWLALSALPSIASVTISLGQTENMSCGGGVCAPTATDAVLNAGDLETMLASGSVEVTTTGSGIQATDMAVNAPLSWSNTNTLSLEAYDSIAIDKSVSVAGLGGLNLMNNDGGTGGTLSFGQKGNVGFQNLSSALTINGQSFVLVGTLPDLSTAIRKNSRGAYALANSYNAAQDGTYNRPPITKAVKGMIEGLGNAISHLSIREGGGRIGAELIANVASTGAVADLRLVGIRYKVKSQQPAIAGGLVGNNNGYLSGDEVSGSIVVKPVKANGYASSGGLAHINGVTGTISSSSADVNIVASGLSTGGGLVGWNDGTISLSHAAGNVSAFLAGGLVGQNEGAISQDFASGTVGGEAGGLVGANETDGIDTGTIDNSYSTGAVYGSFSGGFVQLQDSSGLISSSYSTGAVASQAGGFACTGGPQFTSDDYWDVTTSGTSYGWCEDLNTNEVTGLTSKQLRSGLPPGFDPSIWAENPKINNGFPYLINNPPDK